jgi:Mg2+ and Co2+ transporter CorA
LQKLTPDQQYQINQFPRKRQLRDIHALQEELSVVQSVNSWQQQSFEKFRRVLDPKSFSDLVPQSRISMFPPEAECLDAGLKTLQSKATELDALEQRTQYLRQQLKQSVEILEADHGKAILVFTMITTIFLPLYVFRANRPRQLTYSSSFVTSFFGMNTADIRSTDRGQGYFWAIAVPVTAGIVFAAVLIAYHGDKLYDAVLKTTHQFTERRSASPETVSRPERKSSWGGRSAMYRRSWKTRR